VVIAHDIKGSPALTSAPPVPEGQAAALVCRGNACSLPIADPEALKRELAGQ